MRTPGPVDVALESTKPVAQVRYHFAILTHGALAATRRCLASIAQTVARPFQVFVVDNASDDATPAWLQAQAQSHAWLHWRLNRTNRGVPGGRNDLLAFALPHLRDEDWLVFCDNDLEFEPGWLAQFEAAMAAFPNARVLGKVGHFVTVDDDRRVLAPAATQTGPVDVVSGGFACFVRADAARAIGAFDERLGLFWHEDDDYCVRALQLGCDVVAVPEAAIVHHEHATGLALPGLREGGSLANQRYLAQKWRAAGWIDEGGWVRRRDLGCYQPPAVRAELRRRGGWETPIGRSEFAAAWHLLDRLVGSSDPQVEFVRQRRPMPRCLPVMIEWHHECATAGGERELAARLADLVELLPTARTAARLAPRVRVPQQVPGPVGHGLLADSDFDDPDWLAVADDLEPGHCMRDPAARSRAFWEEVSLLLNLQRTGALVVGGRAVFAGRFEPRVLQWVGERGMSVAEYDPSQPPPQGSCDLVVVKNLLEAEVLAGLLAAGHARATVALVGDVVLDGAPTRGMPQPGQLLGDLLGRAGLVPTAPIRTVLEDAVLEGCTDTAMPAGVRPELSRIERRLATSFVAVARRVPAPARPQAAVLVPAAPLQTPRLRIGVDLRTVAFADSLSRGIGHFAVYHLAAIARRAPDLRFVCYLPDGAELPAQLALANVERRDVDRFTAADVDVMHLPDPMNLALGFDSPLRVFRHPRTTLTFHDLTPLRHYLPAWPERNRAAYLDRLAQIERSDALLLCNSEFTRDDVVATLGLARDRAVAILAGRNGEAAAPSPEALAAVRARFGITGEFVLHVGALDPHKNFPATLSAFLQVRRRRPLHLVVVGAVDPGVEYFGDYCAARGIPDVVFAGYLPRRELDALYGAAAALLFQSRSEGFGFPLLEAMAAGCPVVATDVTSHPEVVGDAGLLVPVDDPAAAAQALERLFADAGLAARCRAAGRARAATFTWDAVAERTLAVWRAMVPAGADSAQAWTPGASMPVFSTHST